MWRRRNAERPDSERITGITEITARNFRIADHPATARSHSVASTVIGRRGGMPSDCGTGRLQTASGKLREEPEQLDDCQSRVSGPKKPRQGLNCRYVILPAGRGSSNQFSPLRKARAPRKELEKWEAPQFVITPVLRRSGDRNSQNQSRKPDADCQYLELRTRGEVLFEKAAHLFPNFRIL